MAKATTRWKRSNPDDRKAEILAVARRHFATKQFDAVSTADIADEIGINRGLVYHYFGTKRDLYLEVVRSTVKVPTFPPIPDMIASGTFEDVLEERLDQWLIEVEREREGYLAATMLSASGPDAEARAMVQASREEAIDTALASMFASPDDAPASVRACVRALGSLAETAVTEWLAEGHLSRDQVRELLVQTARALWENLSRIMMPPPIKAKRRGREAAPADGDDAATPA